MPFYRSSITTHDDVLHHGSAKRDTALGLAGLDASKNLADSYPLKNILRGIVPTASGWGTAPINLANCTDGNVTTATGTGSTNMLAAGNYGEILFDLTIEKRILVGGRVGIWAASARRIKVYLESSDDGINFRSAGVLGMVNSSTYGDSGAESIVDLMPVILQGQYFRVRFNIEGGASNTANAKIYQVWGYELAV